MSIDPQTLETTPNDQDPQDPKPEDPLEGLGNSHALPDPEPEPQAPCNTQNISQSLKTGCQTTTIGEEEKEVGFLVPL